MEMKMGMKYFHLSYGFGFKWDYGFLIILSRNVSHANTEIENKI